MIWVLFFIKQISEIFIGWVEKSILIASTREGYVEGGEGGEKNIKIPTIHNLLERQHGRLEEAGHDVVLFGGAQVHLDGVLLVLQLGQLLRLGDPVDVALEVLLHLLLGSQSLEVPTRLGLLLLLGELSD